MADANTDTSSNQPAANGSAILFTADAQGILEAAPDLDTGLELLSQLYGSKNWDDKPKAQATAADYAQQLRYRFRDSQVYSPEETHALAPINLSDTLKNPKDVSPETITDWEIKNNNFLDNTSVPEYVVARDKLKKSVSQTASEMRRDLVGAKVSATDDFINRMEEGMLGPIAKATGNSEYLTGVRERTNPDTDQNLISSVASAGGVVLGAMGAGAMTAPIGGVGAWVYLGAVLAGEVRGRYSESMEATGDPGLAKKAAALELGNQAIQTYAGAKLWGGTANLLAKKILSSEAAEASIPLLSKAASALGIPGSEKVAGKIAGKALEGSALAVTGQVLGTEAQRVGTDNSAIHPFDNLSTSAIVGAIFGAGTGAIDAVQRSRAIGTPPVKSTDESPPIIKSTNPRLVDPASTQEGGISISENGTKYVHTPDNLPQRIDPETGEKLLPQDAVFYTDPETTVKLNMLSRTTTPDGQPIHIMTGPFGENLIVVSDYVDSDLNVTKTPTGKSSIVVPKSDTPAVGLHPIEVSSAKSLNGVSVEIRKPYIGEKLTSVPVLPDTKTEEQSPAYEGRTSNLSVGAAGPTKESRLAYRARISPDIDEAIRAGLGDKDGGFVRYMPVPHVETKDAAEKMILAEGTQAATEHVLGMPDSDNSVEITMAGKLAGMYQEAALKARDAGDSENYGKLSDIAARLIDKSSMLLTGHGRSIEATKMWNELDPGIRVISLKKQIRDAAVAEVATETGRTPKDLGTLDQQIKVVDDQIAEVKSKTTKLGLEEPAPVDAVKLEGLNSQKIELKRLADKVESRYKKNVDIGLPADKEALLTKLYSGIKKTEGTQQQQLIERAIALEREAKLNVKVPDNPDWWYNTWIRNVLTDPSTQAVNVIGTGFLTASDIPGHAISDITMGHVPQLDFVKSLAKTLVTGGFDAMRAELKGIKTFRSGRESELPSSRNKLGISRSNDAVRNASRIERFFKLNYLFGMPLRGISGEDAMFFKSNYEGEMQWIARVEGQRLGLKGDALVKYVAEKTFGTESDWNEAFKQATENSKLMESLGFKQSPEQTRLAAWEIRDAKRPEYLRDLAGKLASKTTFGNKPDGYAGFIVNKLGEWARHPINIAGKEFRIGRYYFPFLNMAGNIWNATTDHSVLLGFGEIRNINRIVAHSRAAKELARVETQIKTTGEAEELGPQLHSAQAKELSSYVEMHKGFARYMTGAAAAAIVGGLVFNDRKDPNPYFDLIGKLPSNADGKARRDRGERDWSFKVGDNYWRFSETPLALTLAPMAALRELWKSNGGAMSRADMYKATGMAIGASAEAFMDKGFLKTMGDFLGAITDHNGGKLLDALVMNPAKGFIPGVSFWRAVSKLTDNPIDTTYNTLWSKIVSGIPAAQSYGTLPALNQFGEPISRSIPDRLSFIGRFYSEPVTDPATKWLTENDYHIAQTGITIKLPQRTSSQVKELRRTSDGEAFEEILTPEERHKYVAAYGPKVKQLVLTYASRYGNSGHQEAVQKHLNSDVSRIKLNIRSRMFGTTSSSEYSNSEE